MEYDNTNKGSIWKNDKKATDKHPDFRGSINAEGKEYWLSAWKGDKTNPRAPVLKLAVTLKEENQAQQAHNQAKGNAYVADDLEDEIPF